MLISAFDMSNTTWCPLCRIKVEILDITNNKFCYGCQENTDVYVLKCGNTHGMCKECTSNFDLAIVDRPIDRENEYRQAVINEENRIQEELLREEAINKKIAEIKIELKKRRDDKIRNYINYQKRSYEYIKKEIIKLEDEDSDKNKVEKLKEQLYYIQNTDLSNEFNIIDEFDSHHNYLQSMFNTINSKKHPCTHS